MRILISTLIFLFAMPSFGQVYLSASRQHSKFKYVYLVTANEARVLYTSHLNKVNESFLHMLVDSFDTDLPEKRITQPGNYLLVHALKNNLHYELLTVGDVNSKVVNNKRDLALILHDRKGNFITDAKVHIDKKRILFHPGTASYRIQNRSRQGNLEVTYKNVFYFFPLRNTYANSKPAFLLKISRSFPVKNIRSLINSWGRNQYYRSYFNNTTDYERKFTGYMVFNKPSYKPGDTVFMKAVVMTKKGNPINKNLLLRISDQSLIVDSIIGLVKPYRKGGYEFSFVLSDSLDLDLDERYLLTLEEERSRKYDLDEYDGNLDEDEYAMKRKVVMRGRFHYEDYELKAIKFAARTDKKVHNRGDIVSVYLRAKDENDLAVMDGRTRITIKPSNHYNTRFAGSYGYIPDTLFTHEQQLETLGETKILIPDSIFPEASFDYTIECEFLNSNNEYRSYSLQQKFSHLSYSIIFEEKNDSLTIKSFYRGTGITAKAWLYGLNSAEDTVIVRPVDLPAAILMDPFIQSYRVKTDSASGVHDRKSREAQVSAVARRTRDSVFVELVNPEKVQVWYTLFAGKRIISRGYGDAMRYEASTRTAKPYFVSLQYIYADRIVSEEHSVPFQDKLLQVDVKQNPIVYPGMKSTVSITVSDVAGKPVADADLTAYAVTNKFEYLEPPYVPYLGKVYRGRVFRSNYSLAGSPELRAQEKLNWKKWSRQMNLDSIEYYKFLHPDNFYINREPSVDQITQVAPFIILNGEVQPIHIIYVDEKPVYFSHAADINHYSFPTTPGLHHIRLRTNRQEFRLKMETRAGMKTVFSLNANTKDTSVTIKRKKDVLSNEETSILRRYLIVIENTHGSNFTYVKQDDRVFPVNFNSESNNEWSLPWIGPVYPKDAELVVKDRFRQHFTAEGNYSFRINSGFIRQKEIAQHFSFNKHLSAVAPSYNLRRQVLTEKQVDSLWTQYLDERNANVDILRTSTAVLKNPGQLRIHVEEDELGNPVFVRNLFLFRKDNPDYLRVYKGMERNLGFLEAGTYRVFLLLKNDAYFIMNDIHVKPFGLNYYASGVILAKRKDSVSSRLSNIVNEATTQNWQHLSTQRDEIIDAFHSSFLDLSSFTKNAYGIVKNDKGEPLAGVSVMVKRTGRATVTDANGRFHLLIPERGTLVFHYVGYNSVEVNIEATDGYEVRLLPAANKLDEVIVTGYAVRKRSNLTASVSSVTQLSGHVAGIAIRGNATRNDIKPLIIVNGLPYAGNMEDLDPSAITSTQVMEKAAATAIYGSAAAGGVILINTKEKKETAGEEPAGNDPAYSLRRNFRDYAYWQPRLRTNESGNTSFNVIYPDDVTSWRTFVLVTGNKKRTGYHEGVVKSFKSLTGNLGVPQFIVEGDSVNIIAKTLHYLPDSVQVRKRFHLNNALVNDEIVSFRNAYVDTFQVVAKSLDSLQVRFTIEKADGYSDGEERNIPAYARGVLETSGRFENLVKDTSIIFTPNPSLGKTTIYAETSVLPVLLDEVETIRRYEYLCNEQLASKLKALLVEEKIKAYLKQEFKRQRDIRDLISKLNQNKKRSLWGWWANNDPLGWVSLHVIEALLLAEKHGYKTNLNNQQLINTLVYELEASSGSHSLYYLQLLQSLQAKVDYKKYTDSLASYVTRAPLYQKLRWMQCRQAAGITIDIDTILAKSRKTLFGNKYWGEEKPGLFDNSIQNTLLVYKLVKSAGLDSGILSSIRNYFLEQRRDGHWRNTYESSLILETILPDLLAEAEKGSAPTLQWNDGETRMVNSFPFTGVYHGDKPLTISKTGSRPVYFTAYQQGWNSNPLSFQKNFTVETYFETNKKVTSLKPGQAVTLKVQVKVEADADYVMIEVPIPAGCSYQSKAPSYRYNEVHREHFKNKVSIFCSKLDKGNYEFNISLMPRYTGSYNFNPAKAEMMYFPVFFGREQMKRIKIN